MTNHEQSAGIIDRDRKLKHSNLSNAECLPMAFGHRHATFNRDVNSLYDMISGVTPKLKSYECVGQPQKFFHRSAFVSVNDLALAATVCSPTAYEVSEDDDLYFILPFHGQASAESQGKNYLVSPIIGAALTPGFNRKGFMSEMSMLQATLNPTRLKATALAMRGTNSVEPFHEDRLARPYQMSMRVGHIRFDQLCASLCKTIDDCDLDVNTLNALGFDDFFYRFVAGIAFPELINASDARDSTNLKTPIERVCDYIDAHLTDTIYLTDLEVISQLGTRALQYAFLRRFGCTPISWIRQRRLALAHQRLLRPQPSDTVTSIALDCGFSNPSDFARLYSKTYGASPKFTLGQSTGLNA